MGNFVIPKTSPSPTVPAGGAAGQILATIHDVSFNTQWINNTDLVGFTLPTLTSGSVLFSNGTTIAQDNSNFFWDNTNKRLGIGTATPLGLLDVKGQVLVGDGNRTNRSSFALHVSGSTGLGLRVNRSDSNTAFEIIAGFSGIDEVRLLSSNTADQNLVGYNDSGNPKFKFSSTTGNGFFAGNVGIGTLTPSYKLDVNGTARLGNTTFANGILIDTDAGSRIFSSSNIQYQSNNATLQHRFTNQTGTSLTGTLFQIDTEGTLLSNPVNLIKVINQTTDVLYLKASGNLLLGTATDNGGKLQIKAGGAASTDIALRIRNSGDTNDNFIISGSGFSYFKGGNVDTYISSNTTINSAGRFLVMNSVGSSTQWGYMLQKSGLETARFTTDDANGNLIIQNSWSTYGIAFNTAGANTRMFITGTGNVGIGTTAPNVSSILDVTSTTKGFLPPRMANAERLAIVTPAVGLMVYCTDVVEGLYINKSTGWTFIA